MPVPVWQRVFTKDCTMGHNLWLNKWVDNKIHPMSLSKYAFLCINFENKPAKRQGVANENLA